ncbi:MAG: hypothetical protein RBT46_06300, partial [Weeksellaceae bacterium]|nr:hypothetical protein [Weeksellaceae bacterium]
MKKLIYIILLSYSVNCYSQSFELEYKIDFQRKLSEKLTEEFKANKSGDLARAEIFTYENPKAEFYTLKFNNEFSELTYIEALNNNQEKSHLQVSNFPLGKKNYRKINDTLIYNEHKINNQTLFSADTLICKYWNKTGKDS